MTWLGAFVGLVFIGCYTGMLLGARLEGNQGKLLQWGCWLIACVLITICHLMAPQAT
tara:strand:+ start:2209 stop:2379 length:171 start_codon:yes stop_codon:yes gene_type:complete